MYFAFKHTVSKWRQEDVGDSQKWDLLDRDTLKEISGLFQELGLTKARLSSAVLEMSPRSSPFEDVFLALTKH